MKIIYTPLKVEILFLFHVLFLYVPKLIYCESKCPILSEGNLLKESNIPNKTINYYCFSSNSLEVDFLLLYPKGNPLLYGYHSDQGNDLAFTENDLTLLAIEDSFEKPLIINRESLLHLKLSGKNDPEAKNQFLLIVYCSKDVNCDYSIMYISKDKTSILEKDNPFYASILKDNSLKFGFNRDNFHVNENPISLYIECVIISGKIDISLEKNSKKIDNYSTKFSSNAIKLLMDGIEKQELDSIEIKISGIENSVYSLKYMQIEADDLSLILDSNTIQFHEIQLNKNKTISIPETIFSSEFPVIFNIKTQNCYITVKEKENGEEAKEVKLYQTLFTGVNTRNIELSLPFYNDKNNNNQKDFCTIYTYVYQYTTSSKLILPELVPITTIFHNEIIRMTYLYYFIYNEEEEDNYLNIELDISEGGVVSLQYHFNNVISSLKGIPDLFGHYIHYLQDEYKIYCTPSKLCPINIIVDSIKSDIKTEFTISVYHKRKIAKYINKNEMIYCKTLDGTTNVFYTSTLPGDKGKISINALSGAFLLSANLIHKKGIKSENEIMKKSNSVFKNFFGDIIYEINQDEDCEYGCQLEISVKNNDKSGMSKPMTFHLFIMGNNIPIITPLHKKITNTLENQESIHTYLFTLPKNIFKFQLIIDGEYAIFEMLTTPNITTTSEIFTAPNGPRFIDKEIPFTNTDINAQITIKVKSKKYSSFGSYYEIKVIPFNIFDDKPVYFITDTKEIEVFTGKESSKAYLIFEDQDLYLKKEYAFLGSVQNDMDAMVIFRITPYYASEISLLDPSKIAQNFTKTDSTFVSPEGVEYQLIVRGKSYNYYFIIIDGGSNNELILNCNFNRKEHYSAESSEVYFYDIKPQLYFYPFYKGAQIMKFINYEIEETSPVVWVIQFFHVTGVGTITANQMQLNFQDSIIYIFTKENLNKFDEFRIASISIKDIAFTTFRKLELKSNYIQKLDMYVPHTIMNMGILPFRFYYILDKEFLQNIVNIKLSQQSFDPAKKYNFTNLEIIAFYANDDLIEKQMNNEKITENLITPTIINFESEMLSILSFKIDENETPKYNKLYFEIKEKIPTDNYEILNNMKFDINSFSLTDQAILPLAQNKYVYGYIDPNFSKISNYVLYSENKEKVVIEFASCTKDEITIKFSNSQMDLEFTKESDSGRDVYTLNSPDSMLINMTLKLESDSKELVYFVMKYSSYEKFETQKFYSTGNKISSRYNTKNSTIESEWGKIININEGIKVQYFYTLYEAHNTRINNNSICSPINKTFNNITITNEAIWTNTNNDYFDYVSVVIAFFIDDKGEHLLSFGAYKISGGGKNNIIMIIIIVFSFVVIAVILSTLWLFKQIKKKEREDDEKENVEFTKQNRDSFAQLYDDSEEVSLEQEDRPSRVLVLPKEIN